MSTLGSGESSFGIWPFPTPELLMPGLGFEEESHCSMIRCVPTQKRPLFPKENMGVVEPIQIAPNSLSAGV